MTKINKFANIIIYVYNRLSTTGYKLCPNPFTYILSFCFIQLILMYKSKPLAWYYSLLPFFNRYFWHMQVQFYYLYYLYFLALIAYFGFSHRTMLIMKKCFKIFHANFTILLIFIKRCHAVLVLSLNLNISDFTQYLRLWKENWNFYLSNFKRTFRKMKIRTLKLLTSISFTEVKSAAS